MRKFLKKKTIGISAPLQRQCSPFISKFLYLFTWIIVVLALIAGTFLLASDLFAALLPHMPISAAPLLLSGAAYLAFQVLIRAPLLDLFKALIVSSAFILWGIDQLLPAGWLATTLGDIVIVLYVIDLGWMMMARLRQQRRSRHVQPEKPGHESNVSLPALDKPIPLLLLQQTPSADQPDASQRFVALSKGNASFLKRNRLAPLSCTCASPLAPFQSALCCRAMDEASRSS